MPRDLTQTATAGIPLLSYRSGEDHSQRVFNLKKIRLFSLRRVTFCRFLSLHCGDSDFSFDIRLGKWARRIAVISKVL